MLGVGALFPNVVILQATLLLGVVLLGEVLLLLFVQDQVGVAEEV